MVQVNLALATFLAIQQKLFALLYGIISTNRAIVTIAVEGVVDCEELDHGREGLSQRSEILDKIGVGFARYSKRMNYGLIS